jgi:hypothetical protein
MRIDMQRNEYLTVMTLCVAAVTASTTGCELIASVDRAVIQSESGSGAAGGGGSGGNGGQGGQGGSDTCSNKVQDGNETDVDCGGNCPKCKQGETCGEAADCTSTFCASGVCCEEACAAEECKACSKDAKTDGSEDGTCGPAKAETACRPQSCTDGVETVVDTCDAQGVCTDKGTKACDPGYTCDTTGTACGTTCAQNADCATCYQCTGTACEPVAVRVRRHERLQRHRRLQARERRSLYGHR